MRGCEGLTQGERSKNWSGSRFVKRLTRSIDERGEVDDYGQKRLPIKRLGRPVSQITQGAMRIG